MMGDASTLIVRVIPAVGDDPEWTAMRTRQLRADLLELDVDLVEPVAENDLPEGAKGVADLAGALAVRWGSAGLKAVLTKIYEWVSRSGCSVEATIAGDTIKITGATPSQLEKIVAVWIDRHGPNA